MPGKTRIRRSQQKSSEQGPPPQKLKANSQQGQGQLAFPVLHASRELRACWDLFDEFGLLKIRGVLSPAEALAMVNSAEQYGFQHQSSRGPMFGEALRSNERIAVHSPEFARHLWQAGGLAQLLQARLPEGRRAVGLNPNIRIYRYGPGQHFGKHVDESVSLGPNEVTRYTLLLYLSGICSQVGFPANLTELNGGETVFYGGKKGREVARVVPEVGLALLHRHGDDCLEHEALAVQQGCKYILRSDVAVNSSSTISC